MFKALRSLFNADPAPAAATTLLPHGERVYAVGDIHGCLALFEALSAAIEADDAARGAAKTTVILLGDLIDRGPHSAAVIGHARAWGAQRTVRMLTGNHEEMFLESFEKQSVLRNFLRYGGRETVLSYPIAPAAYHVADIAETQALMRGAIPEADLEFLRGFEDSIRIGDYLFVHAGVQPEAALDQQRPADLRWMREPFLSFEGDLGAVVVHGHTIVREVEVRDHRIGIDTGAYQSGRLTALGLEAGARWLLTAEDNDGTITVAQRSLG